MVLSRKMLVSESVVEKMKKNTSWPMINGHDGHEEIHQTPFQIIAVVNDVASMLRNKW